MEKLILINPGTDAWVVSVRFDTSDVDLTVPIGGQLVLYASEVEHSAVFQEILHSSQYVRNDQPRVVVTDIETPLLGAYLILGAMVVIHVFKFINPFAATDS